MKYIKVKIKTSTTDGLLMKSAVIHSIESSCDKLGTFELPRLMHALSMTKSLIKENTGFPYTFDFEL